MYLSIINLRDIFAATIIGVVFIMSAKPYPPDARARFQQV